MDPRSGTSAPPCAWRQIEASGAPTQRSSHQLSAHGASLYLFGGEAGPKGSHFGYGEPVLSIVHTLDLDSHPNAWHELTVTAS